jgi:hypothetical protein
LVARAIRDARERIIIHVLIFVGTAHFLILLQDFRKMLRIKTLTVGMERYSFIVLKNEESRASLAEM